MLPDVHRQRVLACLSVCGLRGGHGNSVADMVTMTVPGTSEVSLQATKAVVVAGVVDCELLDGCCSVFGYDFRQGVIRITSEPHARVAVTAITDSRLVFRPVDGTTFSVIPEEEEGVEGEMLQCPDAWFQICDRIVSGVPEGGDDGLRILIQGPGSSGKSTLSRFVTNRFLSRVPQVAYLDCDVGQSEFTPCGNVSVIVVRKPVFGPPYSHQLAPQFSVHIGDVTPISNVRYYIDAIRKLLDTFDGSCPLVVNTMGWVDGLGADLLAAVTGLCRPQHIIQISPSTDSAPPRLPSYRPFEFHHVSSQTRGKRPQAAPSPREYRSMGLAAYFLPDRSPFAGLNNVASSITSLPAYRIKFDDIRVRDLSGEALHTSEKALYWLNGSLVALAVEVDEQDPFPNCLGLGIVRAVDLNDQCLYATTPLSLDQLEAVTCIIRGSIGIPADIALQADASSLFHQPYKRAHPASNALGSFEMKTRHNVQRHRGADADGA